VPVVYTMKVRGTDALSEVYLHIAGMMVEHEPVAMCPADWRLFLPRGRQQYCSSRCAARERKRRSRNPHFYPLRWVNPWTVTDATDAN